MQQMVCTVSLARASPASSCASHLPRRAGLWLRASPSAIWSSVCPSLDSWAPFAVAHLHCPAHPSSTAWRPTFTDCTLPHVPTAAGPLLPPPSLPPCPSPLSPPLPLQPPFRIHHAPAIANARARAIACVVVVSVATTSTATTLAAAQFLALVAVALPPTFLLRRYRLTLVAAAQPSLHLLSLPPLSPPLPPLRLRPPMPPPPTRQPLLSALPLSLPFSLPSLPFILAPSPPPLPPPLLPPLLPPPPPPGRRLCRRCYCLFRHHIC